MYRRILVPLLSLLLLPAGTALAHDGSHGAAAQGSAPPPVVATVMTQTLPDYPGKEMLMLTVEYPPGGADPVHKHDAHGFIYVLDGSIVMGVAGGPEVTLLPGQTFHEGPQDIHTVGRNASQDKPAKFLVFLLKDAGKPALTPVP